MVVPLDTQRPPVASMLVDSSLVGSADVNIAGLLRRGETGTMMVDGVNLCVCMGDACSLVGVPTECGRRQGTPLEDFALRMEDHELFVESVSNFILTPIESGGWCAQKFGVCAGLDGTSFAGVFTLP